MKTIVIYSSSITPRLQYVLGWLLKERLQLDFKIITDKVEATQYPFVISYGEPVADTISIPASGLLTQQSVNDTVPAKGTWDNLPVLYAITDKQYTLPFDLFSAIFYLLSRYEEYCHYIPDKHGRYPATHSILHKNGWLQRPIADEWVCAFKILLETRFKIEIHATPFSFVPTYDIDIAYSHLYKGVGRIAGAYLRALLHVDLKQIAQRTKVLKKKQKDPYDSFRWLRQLHKEYGFEPLYFVLSATRTTRYDKNIHPNHPAMMRVIKNLAKEGSVGIHPSYYSAHNSILQQEKTTLEKIAGCGTSLSRQHYIRAVMPNTYRMLQQHGITDDYTMGYGSHLGFRAGTGSSFLWYDIEKESTTTLRIHPFCFMDTTAHYEAKLTTLQSFEKLQAMTRLLQQTGSALITVFHNFSLGTDEEWKGWKQAYEHFMHDMAKYKSLHIE